MTAKIAICIAGAIVAIACLAIMRYCENNVYLKYKEVKR